MRRIAARHVVFLSTLLASTIAPAQTEPAQTEPVSPPATTRSATRPTHATKQLYFAVSYFLPTWRAQLPPGFLPAVVEAGGRYTNAQGKEDSYWVGGYRGPNEVLMPAKLEYAVASLPPGTLYVFDQEKESWSTDTRRVSPEIAERNKRRFIEFSTIVRRSNPLVRVAFYALLPHSDFWMLTRQHGAREVYERWRRGEPLSGEDRWLISNAYGWDGKTYSLDDRIAGNEGRAAFLKWRAASDNELFTLRDDGTRDDAAGIDDAVDALTPSLYTFYRNNDQTGQVTETVAESRRLAGGKPVYPFIWPVYHNSNAEDGGKPVDLDEWRKHVGNVLRQADGCVLWNADPVKHREHIRIVLEEAEKASRGN